MQTGTCHKSEDNLLELIVVLQHLGLGLSSGCLGWRKAPVCTEASHRPLLDFSRNHAHLAACEIKLFILFMLSKPAFLYTSSAPGRNVPMSKELSLVGAAIAMVPWRNLLPVFGHCHVKPWAGSCCSPIRISRRMQNISGTLTVTSGVKLLC